MSITAYEIDFLPVGYGDRSGDAIALRWKDGESYRVLVYDGGTQDAGQALVDLIKTYYGTSRVDYLVNSHPDADHASGLKVVMDQLEVGEVWLHRPWSYSAIIRDYFKDGRITDDSLAERLKAKMGAAYAIEEMALEKGVPIYEPFQGSQIGPFVVLSPEKEWYVHELIPAFEKSPEQKASLTEALDSVAEAVLKAIRDVANWITELWTDETLREDVSTSAENESSAIMLGLLDGRGIFLCGDAGIQTLNRAVDYATSLGLHLPETLRFVQVPHHGSRHNVSSSVLDRIVGERKTEDDGEFSKTAFVSAAKDSTSHPRKMVTNAFIRRGAQVIATQGLPKRHHHNMPARDGWTAAIPLAFSSEVEPWE